MTYKALITDGTLGQGIVDSIVNDAVALGYSCVESRYVHGDMTWAVIKNPASLNYFQSDWHMALGYVTNSKGNMLCHLFENWNTSSKMATAYAPAKSNSWAPTGSYTSGRSPAMLHSGDNFAAASMELFQVGPRGIAGGENYYYSIDADRLCLAVAVNSTNLTTRGALYVGAYERFLPSSLDPVPLVLTRLQSYDANQNFTVSRAESCFGAATREPGAAGYDSNNFTAGWFTNGGNAAYTSPNDLWTGFGFNDLNRKDSTAGPELYSGMPMVSRVPVTGREVNGLRGLFSGLYVVGAAGTSGVGTEYVWSFAGNTYAATQMRAADTSARSLRKVSMEQR